MTRTSPNRGDKKIDRAELKRERDVILLYSAAFRDITYIEEVQQHVPRPSADSTLTALCQLVAIRLGCQRCMVSLLDDQRQHVLAESTQDLSLRPEAPGEPYSSLILGNVSIPRRWSICEGVLQLTAHEESILYIKDLAQAGRSFFRDHVRNIPELHFYASTPLHSPNGSVVGSLCIFDLKPRDCLEKSEHDLLTALGSTVMDYLNTYTIRDQYRRGEQFTRGLVSFAEGASAITPFDEHESLKTTATQSTTLNSRPAAPLRTANVAQPTQEPERSHNGDAPSTRRDNVRKGTRSSSKSKRIEPNRHQSISKLQDSILPLDAKSMFSRAANVMMASSGLDGVLILDASVAANSNQRGPRGAVSGSDAHTESHGSRSSSSSDGGDGASSTSNSIHESSKTKLKRCQVLGAATSTFGGESRLGDFVEGDLGRLFQAYPDGKILTFTPDGLNLSSTEESSGQSTAGDSASTDQERQVKRRVKVTPLKGSKAIQTMLPGARSVAFVPFWDYERSRWFAGCLCWSNSATRLLSASVDLIYLKIFSHSIMRELSRLDAKSLSVVSLSTGEQEDCVMNLALDLTCIITTNTESYDYRSSLCQELLLLLIICIIY